MARRANSKDFNMNEVRQSVAKFISNAREVSSTGWEQIGYGVSILNQVGKTEYELEVLDGNVQHVTLITREYVLNLASMYYIGDVKITRTPVANIPELADKPLPRSVWAYLQYCQTFIASKVKHTIPGQATIFCKICTHDDFEMLIDEGGITYLRNGEDIHWSL